MNIDIALELESGLIVLSRLLDPGGAGAEILLLR